MHDKGVKPRDYTHLDAFGGEHDEDLVAVGAGRRQQPTKHVKHHQGFGRRVKPVRVFVLESSHFHGGFQRTFHVVLPPAKEADQVGVGEVLQPVLF